MDAVIVNVTSVLNRVIGEVAAVRDALNTVGTQPTDVQQPQPTICPWFIHGSNCANYLTTLKCYEKPCSFDRGKQ